jgi:hypothetical protein
VSYAYAAYGLRVESDRPLAGLVPAPAGDCEPLVRVTFAEPPAGAHRPPDTAPDHQAGYERFWRLPDGGRLLHYLDPADGAAWSMRVGPAAIEVARDARFDPGQIARIVETTGLVTVLHLAGVLVLHAAAVAIDDRAVLVLGPSGAGKSTTAAAFVASPRALLSDDVSVLAVDGGGFVVRPGPARLRVLPATARAVGWDPETLLRVFDAEVMGDKRYVELSEAAGTYRAESLPLAAVYALGPRRRGVVMLEPRTARETLPVLFANVFRAEALDGAQRAAIFPSLARIAGTVPARTVGARDDLLRVGEVVEAIVADLSSLRRP